MQIFEDYIHEIKNAYSIQPPPPPEEEDDEEEEEKEEKEDDKNEKEDEEEKETKKKKKKEEQKVIRIGENVDESELEKPNYFDENSSINLSI